MAQRYKLLAGDALARIKDYPDNHFDALFCDAPYGLSEHGDIAPVLQSWLSGVPYKHPKKGFMGKDWDAFVPGPELWREMFRVMKPGAFALVFAGTRTQDLMGISLRLAGFEVRDSVSWVFGSGFPKSLNISKALDKKAGAEREVLGRNPNSRENCDKSNSLYEPGTVGKTDYITAPATEAARTWDGYGTALKPAHEPCLLVQKPLDKTFAHNALTHGCGALNIDASRIGYDRDAANPATNPLYRKENGYKPPLGNDENSVTWKLKDGKTDTFNPSPEGRFPANFILSHHPDCRCVGTREVKSDAHYPDAKTTGFGEFGHGSSTYNGVGHQPKTETVEAWECHEDCPVRLLDEQSGIRPGGNFPAKRGKSFFTAFEGDKPTEGGPRGMGDKGGASRFFYCAKVGTKERNAGLGDEFGEQERDYGNQKHVPVEEGSVNDKFRTSPSKNNHPTLKPLALTKYLATMLLPPAQEGRTRRLLVPFSGSGSEVIGALQAGWDEVVGAELDESYIRIAHARIAHWLPNAERQDDEKPENFPPTEGSTD